MSAAFWFMVAVVGTTVMAFISLAVWLDNRRREREAHYRNEMARRIAEAVNPEPVLEYVRETARNAAAQLRLKTRVAGLITLAVGAALMIFLHQAAPNAPAYLAGLIPLFVGVALLMVSEIIMRKNTQDQTRGHA